MTILSIPEKNTNPSDESEFNNLRDALTGDLLPRNSNGDATDLAADLGTQTYPWLSAGIKNGYLATGTIVPFYDYLRLLPVPHGYMICNGDQITRENYNTQHRSSPEDTTDYWEQFVGSSELEGLYLPGGEERFLMGSASTLPNGESSIPEEGISDSALNLQHNHGGTLNTTSSGNLLFGNDGGSASNYYSLTNSHTHTFTVPNALNIGVTVNPISIDVKFLLKIVE